MARKSRTGVLKRQREMKKAEKAAQKREKRDSRPDQDAAGAQIATADELAAYGLGPSDDEGSPRSRQR